MQILLKYIYLWLIKIIYLHFDDYSRDSEKDMNNELIKKALVCIISINVFFIIWKFEEIESEMSTRVHNIFHWSNIKFNKLFKECGKNILVH